MHTHKNNVIIILTNLGNNRNAHNTKPKVNNLLINLTLTVAATVGPPAKTFKQ